MTQEEMKKFDRKIRAVQDPFGTGFLTLHRLSCETAASKGLSIGEIIRQYVAWKLKSV